MDINWYTSEKIVEEALRTRRAKADAARLAAHAPRYRMRRRIGTMLIKVASTITRSRENGVGRSRAATT